MLLTRSFWSYAKNFAGKYWLWYVAGTFALALTTMISLWLPQLSKEVINTLGQGVSPEVSPFNQDVNSGASGQVFGLNAAVSISQIPLLIVALGALLIIARSLSRILIFWPGQKVASDTRSWMVRQFIRMRQSELMENGLGDLVSRMSNDVTHLRLLCGFGLLQLMNMVFMLGFALVLMIRTDVELTLLALAPISGLLIVTYIGMPFMTRYSRQQQDVMGELTNRVTESFVNVQTIQTHVAYDAFEKRIEDSNQRILQASLKLMIVRTLTFPFMILFSGLAEVLVVLYGGYKVVSGEMTVGDILAFNIYVGILGWPLAAMGIIVSLIQRAQTALARLREVEQAEKEDFQVDDLNDVQQLQPIKESDSPVSAQVPLLEVRRLSFEYPSRRGVYALRDFSLKLCSGERVGLCGPVGAGKSTLFAVITRLYEPAAGTVFLNGKDVTTIQPKVLRKRVRHLSQTVHLFSDSIRMNLSFGLASTPTDSELEEVCKRAQIWQDISEFPKGLSTEIGERGVRLSGGQKQRLTLARMLLRSGELFLFDDVLSAVDTNTERLLLDEFFKLDVPFMISSHRESTLRRCDRVLFLRDGLVEYEGPFAGLGDRLTQISESKAETTSQNLSMATAHAVLGGQV